MTELIKWVHPTWSAEYAAELALDAIQRDCLTRKRRGSGSLSFACVFEDPLQSFKKGRGVMAKPRVSGSDDSVR